MVQTSVIDKIENDDFLKNFLNVDSTGGQLAQHRNLSFPEQIKRLTDGLDLISSELKQKIRHDYPNLIKHSANASKLMVALESLNDDLASLQASVDSLKRNVYAPFEKLEKQISVCERLFSASQIVRKIERFLQLHRKLKATTELSKQAALVYELDALVSDRDLSRIEILIDERASVVNAKQRLLHIANRDLASGIQESNEEAITRSLEIYQNLDMLASFLSNQIESYANDIRQSVKQCFSGADLGTLQKTSIKGSPTVAKGRVPGRVPNLASSMNFKAKLLAGLEWLLTDELFTYCEQVALIDRCLRKLTGGVLVGENPSRDFLARFSRTISELLKASFEESQVHVLQNLQQSLPQLLSFFNALNAKIGNKDIELSRDVFASLHAGYIEKCAANLKIPAVDGGVSEEAIDGMIKNATAELTASLRDDDLLAAVVNVLIACNSDLITKIKASVKSSSEVAQVVALPNSAQLANIATANLIHHHRTRVEEMLASLELERREKLACDRIRRNLDEGRRVTVGILQALLSQIMAHVGNIFLSMHREPSLNSDSINVTAPSLYMGEFQDFLTRSWSSHIAPFSDKMAVAKIAADLTARTIELFMQNLAILRPISACGRQRMRSDCGHLESFIQGIVADTSVLSSSYRILRSLAQLITESPEQLAAGENNLVPPYVVLLMLFGHAAEDLKSPHKAAGWSDEKLVAWLGEHKERDRLELISGALLKYRNHIRERNKTQYDPVYPLISKKLEECMKPFQVAPARGLL